MGGGAARGADGKGGSEKGGGRVDDEMEELREGLVERRCCDNAPVSASLCQRGWGS